MCFRLIPHLARRPWHQVVAPRSEPAKPASPIAAFPTANQSLTMQLAAANETIGILRDLLNATAAALSKLAETISVMMLARLRFVAPFAF